MKSPLRALHAVWRLYADGFRGMTWGRTLWVLLLLKLFVFFVILRLLFFRPVLGGMSEEQKSEAVGTRLAQPCR